MGSPNASVLPVPVCAVATRSRPRMAGGIACACTGVGSLKFCFARLPRRTVLLTRSVKLFIQTFLFFFRTRKDQLRPLTTRGDPLLRETRHRRICFYLQVKYSASPK